MAQSTQPTSLVSVPSASDFTPLSEHESSTPAAFFGGKPVLYAALSMCDLLISSASVKKWDVFHDLLVAGEQQESEDPSGLTNDRAGQTTIGDMSVFNSTNGFITSSSVILYLSPYLPADEPFNDVKSSKAISIPYQCISLHATQRLYKTVSGSNTPPLHHYSALPTLESGADPNGKETAAIYLQLDMDPSVRERTNAADDEDDESDDRTVEVLLIPQPDLLSQNASSTGPSSQHQEADDAKVKEIFEALSRCADLHPDQSLAEDDGGGGLASMLGFAGGSGMPGEGGWITAENAHAFEEELGEYDEGEDGAEDSLDGLGPGAGIRRTRDDDLDLSQENGDDETKWQRTG